MMFELVYWTYLGVTGSPLTGTLDSHGLVAEGFADGFFDGALGGFDVSVCAGWVGVHDFVCFVGFVSWKRCVFRLSVWLKVVVLVDCFELIEEGETQHTTPPYILLPPTNNPAPHSPPDNITQHTSSSSLYFLYVLVTGPSEGRQDKAPLMEELGSCGDGDIIGRLSHASFGLGGMKMLRSQRHHFDCGGWFGWVGRGEGRSGRFRDFLCTANWTHCVEEYDCCEKSRTSSLPSGVEHGGEVHPSEHNNVEKGVAVLTEVASPFAQTSLSELGMREQTWVMSSLNNSDQ